MFIAASVTINAQTTNEVNFNEKVQSLDSTIKTLYNIISGPENKERNWEQFKYLFSEDAEIILTITKSSGNKTKYYLKVDEYINTYEKWLNENGIYTKEIQRMISTFKHLNSVSSAYEYNYSDIGSYQGLNHVNLLKENNRWNISNLKWNQEINDRTK